MQLIIGTSVIPLDPATNLTLVQKSPLFVTPENKIPGSYIFNVSIPAGVEIRREFGQAHRIQRHGRAISQLAYKITDGPIRFDGLCEVTEASSLSYEVAFKIGNGDFTAKLYGKTLKDLDLGGDRNISALYSISVANNVFIYNYDDQAFVIDTHTPNTILSDFSNSMTDDGRTFTAPFDCTVTQFISLNTRMENGALYLTVLKNGTPYIQNRYFSPAEIYDITTELVLLKDDIITIELLAESDIAYEGQQINILILNFRLEYTTVSIFTDIPDKNQYTSDYALFPIHNKEFLSKFPDDAFLMDNLSLKTIHSIYSPVINYYKNGDFPMYLQGYAEGESFFCSNLITPFVYMRTILIALADSAGFAIVNNPFDNEFKNMVIFNAFIENIFTSNNVALLPTKPTFNLIDHVPDMTQNDFLKHIAILTGYMYVIDNNLLTITFVDLKNKHIISSTNPSVPFPGIMDTEPLITTAPEFSGISFELKKSGNDKYQNNIKDLNDTLIDKGSVVNVEDLPSTDNSVNDMYLVTSQNDYYVFQYNSETYILDWLFYSKKFPVLYEEGEEPFLTLTTEFSPVLTAFLADATIGADENRKWIIPVTEQAGIFEGFPDSLNSEYGLQVLYYKGKVLDSLGQEYPLGSSRMADYPSNPDSSPDLSAESLFSTRYSGFLSWLAYETKPAIYNAVLTRSQLQQLKPDQVYSYHDFNYIIKQLTVNMSIDGLSIAELEIYTV